VKLKSADEKGWKKVKILCIGDSMTYGYGVGNKECWVDLLQEEILQEKNGVKVLNFGTNGDTSGYLLERTKRNILPNYAEKGDLAIVMGGANDVLMYGANQYSSDNIIEIAECLMDKGLKVLVGIQPGFFQSPYPFFGPLDPDELNDNFNVFCGRLIMECSEKNIKFFDLREVFSGRDDLFSDGVHPTEAGHRMIFERIMKEL